MLRWSHQLSHGLLEHLDTMQFLKVLQTLWIFLVCHWNKVLGLVAWNKVILLVMKKIWVLLSVSARCYPTALQGLCVLFASALGWECLVLNGTLVKREVLPPVHVAWERG